MGIVKISDLMHENLRVAGSALSRSINAQAEHWMRVGMLAELYPELDHREICRLLVKAELAGGLDIVATVTAADKGAVPATVPSSVASAGTAAMISKPRAASTGKH